MYRGGLAAVSRRAGLASPISLSLLVPLVSLEIPDEVMDTVKAWLEKNKDIEERVKAFLTQNADVRTCFKIVQETDVLERPVWLLKQTYVSNRAEVIRQMLSTQVEWPTDTEILLADMPPSTASEVFSFFDNISGLLGVLIVSQPSDISALGMTRTIDFLRHKGIPIMGLVSMIGRVFMSLLRPSDAPVAFPQARYGEDGQGLWGY